MKVEKSDSNEKYIETVSLRGKSSVSQQDVFTSLKKTYSQFALRKLQSGYGVDFFIPSLIDDADTRQVIYQRLNDVFQVQVYGPEISYPTPQIVLPRVAQQLSTIVASVETALVDSTWDKLLNVKSVGFFLAPLFDYVRWTLTKDYVSAEEVETSTERRQRATKYIEAMANMNLLASTGNPDRFVAGPLLTGLQSKCNGDISNTVKLAVKAFVMERYKYLRDSMHIKVLHSYASYENAFYFRCLQVQQPIKMKLEDYKNSYRRLYGKPLAGRFERALGHLAESKIIDIQDKTITANEEVFENISNKAPQGMFTA